jgi:hypothetical protein
MTATQLARTTAVAFAGAAILAQAALAGGEPKNQWPFTRPVDTRTTQAAIHNSSTTSPIILGEAKNDWPFTRAVEARRVQAAPRSASVGSVIQRGEPKNEPPFSNPAAPATVIVRTSNGFNWSDGAIGLATGIGIALSGGAALALARKSPRTA